MRKVIAYLVDRRFARVGGIGIGKLWELGKNLDHKKAWGVGCDKIGRVTHFSVLLSVALFVVFILCSACGDKLIDSQPSR